MSTLNTAFPLLDNRLLHLSPQAANRGYLQLINHTHPLRQRPQAEQLLPLGPVLLERQAARLLTALLQKCGGQEAIAAVSGYRSAAEQQQIYDSCLAQEGPEFTRRYVAQPGSSEHESGLAIDLGYAPQGEALDFIRPAFPYEEALCQRFRHYAPYYGFIERYQKQNQSLTHIAAEPWHFRYLGYPHSLLLQRRGCALEQYLQLLRNFPQGGKHLRVQLGRRHFEIFYQQAASHGATVISLPGHLPYQISGDNDGGFIVTLWGWDR